MLLFLRLTAVCAAITTPIALLQVRGDASERQETAAGAAAPLTPGQVALLAANDIDARAVEQLRNALVHADPSIRAVASRIAGVSRVTGLGPELAAALAREEIMWAAVEQIRALLLINTPDTRAAVAQHLDRGGLEAVEILLESVARTSPARIPGELARLLKPYGPAAVAHVVPVLARTFTQPEVGEAVLKELLRITSGQEPYGGRHSWRAVVEVLGAEIDQTQAAVLREALQSAHETVRQETVWALLTRLRRAQHVPEVVMAAARPSPRALQGSTTWESFGRELIARRIESGDQVDHAELLETTAKHHRADAQTALALDRLTRRERSVLKDIVDGNQAGRTSGSVAGYEAGTASARVRSLPVMWPQLYTTLVGAANCPITERPRYGALQITYAADGRPSSVRIAPGDLPEACHAVIRALARLIVRPATLPTDDDMEWVVVPVSQDFATCLEGHVPDEIESHGWMKLSGMGLGMSAIKPPARLHHVNPVYPTEAQRQKIQGVVIIESTISAGGCVPSGRVVRSIPALDFSALRAVLDWRFTPTLVDGKPVPVVMTVTVNFTLN